MDTKTVVVTGAGSGIGRAIARELAAREWIVVATDLVPDSAAETVAGLGGVGGHRALGLDVSDPDGVAGAVAEITAATQIDAWVSNAGISRMVPFLAATPADLDRTIDVNLKGVFHCGQAAARAMVEQGRGGAIVNIASMAGKQGRVPYLADYVASKFGVVGLTQAMAFELAEHRIRVNSVCPGYVDTPMQSRELAWEADLRGSTPEAVRDMWIADTPWGRLEQPEDVARAVAFLLSDDAGFVTGEALAVNGGAFMD